MREQDPIRGQGDSCSPTTAALWCRRRPPTPSDSGGVRPGLCAALCAGRITRPYEAQGGVKAIEEVRFSIIHNRGCFGGCNFCALAFHQGRMVTARSQESVLREAEEISAEARISKAISTTWAGRRRISVIPPARSSLQRGMCERNCLTPEPCPRLDADHSDYLELLRKLRALPRVKRVFIRSGIRFDYLLKDPAGDFFSELVRYHVSGQLKVAPEHCCDNVLAYMAKPKFAVFEAFREKFQRLNQRFGKEQYLVPYMISSHPGCTLKDAVRLSEYLNRIGHMPEQVQDFYPTPGTVSTCMYYTGLDPRTMEPVYVPRDPHEKAMQRALLQWRRPEKRALVLEALRAAGREDLIGFGKRCLIRPEQKKAVRAQGAYEPRKRGKQKRRK